MRISFEQAALRMRQQVSHFVPLTDQEWNAVVPHLTLNSLHKHHYLIQQGQLANQIGFVLTGQFRQFYSKDGQEWTTYFFSEDQLVGAYMSCVSGQPSPVSIQAMSEVTYISFSYSVLQALFQQFTNWQLFGRLLAEYIMVSLEQRMASLLLLSPEERYLDLLEGDQKKLLQQVPQHYIANYLGITPVSLSRIRNRIHPRED